MIHIIVCGYTRDIAIDNVLLQKCLASINMQTCKDYRTYIKIDRECNRKYLVENTVTSIRETCADPDDIIACVDADDFLCDEMALQIVIDTYQKNPALLLTYGSYVNLSSNKTGKFCSEYGHDEQFRTSEWRGSHLKTFKKKLFDLVPDEEFRDMNGDYFKCCADRAMMIPMMEIAGHDRIKHIDMILYCYNDLNEMSVWKTMRDLSKETRQYIASKKPLRMIENI